jgi:glutaminase
MLQVNRGQLAAFASWLLIAAAAGSCAAGRAATGGDTHPSNAAAEVMVSEPTGWTGEAPPGAMLVADTSGALAQAPAAGTRPAQRRPAAPGDPYREALIQAHKEWKGLTEGKNADYIPALAKVDPNLFGIALVTAQGTVYEIGSSQSEFSIQSVSKPFTLARAIDAVGLEAVQQRIGVNATGQKFNSILAIELNQSQKRPAAGNPFVNAGAIATVDILPATNATEKWDVILGMYSAFAGRRLQVNQEVYRSETETNTHNQAIVALLKDYEVIKGEPAEALDLYTRQCSVNVNARDLAIMGATLANGGKNPVTRQQIVKPETASRVLAVMATAGLYETTGDWMAATGSPAKSGVGGGIVAVMPGRYAIATFAPPLDEAGNSVRGQKAIESIIKRLGGGVFASRPVSTRPVTAAATTTPAPGSTTATPEGN